MNPSLRDGVIEALSGSFDPENLESWRFAEGILPIFPLVRSLFSQNEVDTTLKLMLLHEVSRAGGRSSMDRIRALVSFLDPGRVDGLVRSLREGGWLELRASDDTYVPSIVGMNLLAILHAADLGNVSPANALARAARSAEFGAKLDGSSPALAFLLDNLTVLIEGNVDQARAVLQQGRPHRLVAWARQEHLSQLGTIREVLGTLQDRLDEASREFSRVTQLHIAMQELVRMHTGIHSRLREWNLERLHSTEGGYSLAQLAEAVLGTDERLFERALAEGIVGVPAPAASLCIDEVFARFHASRRRLPGQDEAWSYTPPEAPERETWTAASSDSAEALRLRLAALTAPLAPGNVLLPSDWLDAGCLHAEGLGAAAWQLAALCRLEAGGPVILLPGGGRLAVHVPHVFVDGVTVEGYLPALEAKGALVALPFGWMSAVRLEILESGDARARG